MRALWEHQGGTLLGDLDTATLKYQAPAAAAS